MIKVDPRLIKLLDVDIRIVMTWHADMTDIDLWVTEPSGEKAFYSHSQTAIGGSVSRDFTQGYGPEEYILRKAMRGTYKVEANYYGTTAVELSGPITLQLDVYTNYGRRDEMCKSVTLRLAEKKETLKVASILAAFILITGCGGFLSRPKPTKEKYLAKNLPEIPPSQIVRFDFRYRGSVGGSVSLARVEVKDVSLITPLWNLPEKMALNFTKDTPDETAEVFLKCKLTVADDVGYEKSIPSWVDITYTEPVYLHEDGAGTRRSRTFFLRKNNLVFYLLVGED